MRKKIILTLFLLVFGINVVFCDDLSINKTQAHLLANKMIANVEEAIKFLAQRSISAEMNTHFKLQDGGCIQLLSLNDESQLTDFQISLVTKLKKENLKQITASDSRYFYSLKVIVSSGESCIKCHAINSIHLLYSHAAIFVTIPVRNDAN